MKLITDEKALNLSIQLLENDKLIKDQMTAENAATKEELTNLNTSTKEELTNLNNSTKQELLDNTDAVKQELQKSDAAIQEAVDTKAPINSPDFKGSVTVDGKDIALSSDVDNKLRLSEPYIVGRELVANGYGIIIDSLDENTNRATYYTSGQKKYIDFPVGYSVVGGAVDGNCASSSIVMNSGNVNIIQGGSDGDGSVSEANIIINGGTVKSVVGGGYPNLSYSGKANHTGSVNIIIKNVANKPSIFGGGYSYASVGNVNIDIFGGEYEYVTVGGSNGSVGYGCVNVNGGFVDVLQGVNHGYIGSAVLCVDGGNVKSIYAGMEPGDDNMGAYGHVSIYLRNGSIGHLYKGDDASGFGNISGSYYEDVVNKEDAKSLGLTLKDKYDVTKNDVKEYVSNALTIREF